MIYNRPIVLAVIVIFTVLTNLLVIFPTLTDGVELTTPLVILFNFVIPCLSIAAAVGLWNIKQWGWLLLASITGINVTAVILFMFTFPTGFYIPYLMQKGAGLLIGATILYYLFHKNLLALFNIPLDSRKYHLNKTIIYSAIGGFILCLILLGLK